MLHHSVTVARREQNASRDVNRMMDFALALLPELLWLSCQTSFQEQQKCRGIRRLSPRLVQEKETEIFETIGCSVFMLPAISGWVHPEHFGELSGEARYVDVADLRHDLFYA